MNMLELATLDLAVKMTMSNLMMKLLEVDECTSIRPVILTAGKNDDSTISVT